MARVGLIWAVSILGLGLVGCGGGSSEGGGGETQEPQETSTNYEGAIASTDVATGEQLYNDVCMACHASSHPLPNLGLSAAAMRRQIREGGGGMPAIAASQLSDADMEAVLAFMVTNGAVMAEGGSAGGEDADGDHDEGGEAGGEDDAI